MAWVFQFHRVKEILILYNNGFLLLQDFDFRLTLKFNIDLRFLSEIILHFVRSFWTDLRCCVLEVLHRNLLNRISTTVPVCVVAITFAFMGDVWLKCYTHLRNVLLGNSRAFRVWRVPPRRVR